MRAGATIPSQCQFGNPLGSNAFREDGVCEPMPRGGSTSPLEKYSQQILVLILRNNGTLRCNHIRLAIA